MSDIHDLHPPKTCAGKASFEKEGAANESDRTAILKAKLQSLLSEHRDLDDVISQVTGASASTSCGCNALRSAN